MDITLDIQDDVALIKMDDGKKNAITQEALAGIEQSLDEAAEKANAVVLAGRPGSFCAGFDLATMTGSDREATAALGQRGGRMALRLYSFPKPLLAACTGHAFTIGAIWMAACDTRIGESGDFKFGMVETKMGMVLPSWAIEPLKARLNPMHFVAAIAQSKLYDAADAVNAGFLDSLVPEGQAIEATLAEAAELAKLPTKAYAGNKMSTRGEALERMKVDLH
ncbi:MAG: crotonase/enoyl-CoA hydratase family protein [Pseudomonadota bacterium]